MTQPNFALPPENLRQARERRELIDETQLLGFEVWDAEQRGAPRAEQLALKLRLYERRAELLGKTPGWCPEAAEEIARTRRKYLERAECCRATLVQLLAQEG